MFDTLLAAVLNCMHVALSVAATNVRADAENLVDIIHANAKEMVNTRHEVNQIVQSSAHNVSDPPAARQPVSGTTKQKFSNGSRR